MTNELSKERAIEALYTVRAYYASLTAGYPKGKDCRGIGDVMCSEIANSCLMAIKALEEIERYKFEIAECKAILDNPTPDVTENDKKRATYVLQTFPDMRGEAE